MACASLWLMNLRIYIFDLRGNQRTQGEESRREGGKVFGSGSRAPIAITLLIKNPARSHRGIVHYFDVGDYKTREEKLDIVSEYTLVDPDWRKIEPDNHGDWLNQRNGQFEVLAPIGINKLKDPTGLFSIWSSGVITHRDNWMYSFSQEQLLETVTKLSSFFNSEMHRYQTDAPSARPEDYVNKDDRYAKWDKKLFDRVRKGEEIHPDSSLIIRASYRPYCHQYLYYDSSINWSHYQLPKLLPLVHPSQVAPNLLIAVSGGRGFTSLITNEVPDLHYDGDPQCFPMYWYERDDGLSLFPAQGEKIIKDAWGNRYIRHDAITDRTLDLFRAAYPAAYANRPKTKGGSSLTKEDIFYYVYGILHSSDYREKFAANLAKELPRIPLVRDFEQFADAGRQLAHIHLHYEELEPWPTCDVDMLRSTDPGPVQKIKWAKKKDSETGKRVDDHTKLVYNTNLTISGIPEEAQNYVVNGRSPLDWVIDRYQVKTDKKSGITNDPNDYSNDPWYIVDLIVRLVRVSMETQQIVQSLPTNIDEISHPDNWPVEWSMQ